MKWGLMALGSLVAAIAGGLFWLGAFQPLAVKEQRLPARTFVYFEVPGLDASHAAALTEDLDAWLEGLGGHAGRQSARVSYPEARNVPPQVGFLVDRAIAIEDLGADRMYRPVAAQRAMVVRFPYRTGLSYTVGWQRVRPVLDAHRAARGYSDAGLMVVRDGDSLVFSQTINDG